MRGRFVCPTYQPASESELWMPKYDVILRGGTILDPANSFEEVADLAILAGKVERVCPELDPGRASKVVDVEGKWVMPGQIDTHAHVAGLARNWGPGYRLRNARTGGHHDGAGHGRLGPHAD